MINNWLTKLAKGENPSDSEKASEVNVGLGHLKFQQGRQNVPAEDMNFENFGSDNSKAMTISEELKNSTPQEEVENAELTDPEERKKALEVFQMEHDLLTRASELGFKYAGYVVDSDGRTWSISKDNKTYTEYLSVDLSNMELTLMNHI